MCIRDRGWTGQCAIVRWPEEVVRIMNVREEKKGGPLTEVIYATLDGRVYFLDLYDGQATRPAINIGAPIKGSVTVDPRGYPLLYVGQGIDVYKRQSRLRGRGRRARLRRQALRPHAHRSAQKPQYLHLDDRAGAAGDLFASL